MYLQSLNQKTQQTGSSKDQYRQAKASEQPTIPGSWGLNEMQRDFIEMMMDKNHNS